MAWAIEISDTARKQPKNLARQVGERIQTFLEERVVTAVDPRDAGAGLSGDLAHFLKYRVGDYRIICELRAEVLIVRFVRVSHRREAYR